MAFDPDNLFAKIIRGEIPSHKVYEDEHTFAFLDIMPRADGHTLVIPKRGAESILDVEPSALAHVMATVRTLAPSIVTAMNAGGFMIQQFNGEAAGQTVFHLHVHIVPRTQGLSLRRHGAEENRMSNEDLAMIAKRIQTAVGALPSVV